MKIPATAQSLERWGAQALILALYLGGCILIAYWVGTNDVRTLIWCLLLAILSVVSFGLQRRAWVLIPLAWLWVGYTAVLPLPLSIRDTAVLLAVCAYVGHRVVGHRPTNLSQVGLDWMIWANVFYLGITFVLHPVGLGIFGSEMIGGRPYITVTLAVLAYQVMIRAPNSPAAASRIPFYLLAGAALLAVLFLIGYLFPTIPGKLPLLFAALDVNVFGASLAMAAEIPRYQRLGDLGLMLALILCAYFPPRTLLSPFRWRFWLFVLALICVLASGFRNVTLWFFAAVILGAWLHDGWGEIVVVVSCFALVLCLLLVGQGRLYELPTPAQRGLAFLPGKWSTQVIDDVKTSTEGRFQWWRDVIQYRMIKNWWVGDGFGARADDLASLSARGATTSEFMMETGGFHNGPLTAIRYAGIIGLILLYGFMAMTAIVAIQFVRRCRGEPLFPLAVFIAIQAIWSPVHYTFVFGGYDAQLPQQIFLAALLRLVIRFHASSVDSGRAESAPRPGTRRLSQVARFRS